MKPTSLTTQPPRAVPFHGSSFRAETSHSAITRTMALALWLLIPSELASEAVIDSSQKDQIGHSESKVNLDLLQYSRVFQSATHSPEKLKTSRGNDAVARERLDLLNNNLQYANENCYSFDFDDSCNDTEFSTGAALGKLLRTGFKAWWRNLPPTKLHRIEEATPEAVKTGNLSGSTNNQWDYSLKLKGDKVRFKLEREFE